MTDKNENRVIVLQNVIVKRNSIKSGLYKKTKYNTNELNSHNEVDDSIMSNLSKRRHTASTYIFDEEPIFSDSDEEKEYSNNILATQKCLDSTNETPKRLEVEIHCNLSSDDFKIIDIIKKCAGINIENVKDDFKQLISLCKELHIKYKHIPLSNTQKLPSEIIITNSGCIAKEISDSRNQVSKNLPNVQQLIPASTFDNQYCQEKLLPSRYGSSGTQSDAYFSETFSFNSGFSNSNSVTKSFNTNEEKENIVRRSSRIRKPANPNISGIFITGKNRKTLNKSRARVKIERNINDRQKESLKTTFKPVKPNRTVKQLRSLARNWMKAKSVAKNDKLPNNSGSVSLQPKRLRRLYSPDEWLQSQELINLFTN